MTSARFLIVLPMLALTTLVTPACAWESGEAGPFSFLFHHYGDDMYQPPITPDRPYWHGDDAVPPDLRWHDRAIEVVDEYGFTVGTRVPEPEPLIAARVEVDTVGVSGHRRVRRAAARPRHRPARLARAACPPTPLAPTTHPLPPPVPASTER